MSSDDDVIDVQFWKMGARLRLRTVPVGGRIRERVTPWARRMTSIPAPPVRLDVRRDGSGEYFELTHRHDVDVSIADVRPADRHLLLVAHTPDAEGRRHREAFLCGHDERHWFVAAIPEQAGAYDVQGAKDALKPPAVWEAMAEHGVLMAHRDRRRTAAFVRQGEWFFIPRPRLRVDDGEILENEPIQRGDGQPHLCQFLYRTAGERVHVCDAYPNGVTAQEFRRLPKVERRRFKWRQMVRGADVFVKGTVRHPDHDTIRLDGWHQVIMNTETQSRAMRHVAFLD
jgi:hypothetical protein